MVNHGASLLRLASCVFTDARDGWQAGGDRRFLSEASMAQLYPAEPIIVETRGDTPSEVIDSNYSSDDGDC